MLNVVYHTGKALIVERGVFYGISKEACYRHEGYSAGRNADP